MEKPFIEVAKGESVCLQAWQCETCGEHVGFYSTNEFGQRFLLPLSSCCHKCGAGPQTFELVSGRWQHVIERRLKFLGHRVEERVRVRGFIRTGMPQQMSEFTEKFLDCGTFPD